MAKVLVSSSTTGGNNLLAGGSANVADNDELELTATGSAVVKCDMPLPRAGIMPSIFSALPFPYFNVLRMKVSPSLPFSFSPSLPVAFSPFCCIGSKRVWQTKR